MALANPGYPPYRHILIGARLRAGADRDLGRDALGAVGQGADRRAPRAPLKGVVIASPANPTGTMMDADALARLIAVAEAEGIRVISDEIYHGLDYAFAAETARELSERAVVINSFSKYFCMTGWRIGWMVVPESLVRPIERLAGQSRDFGADAVADRGAKPLSTGAPRWKRSSTATKRTGAFSREGLPKAGLDKFLPVDGAFYLYADISRFSDDSLDFAKRMLNEAACAATPGIDFDPIDGRHFLRFCYAGSAGRDARGGGADRQLADKNNDRSGARAPFLKTRHPIPATSSGSAFAASTHSCIGGIAIIVTQ